MKEKEQALRYNNNKPHWSLVHFDSLEPLVRVLEYGEKKYTTVDASGNVISGRNNWKKGMPLSAIMESLFRHVNRILNGEFTDKESGQPHIGHVMANAMFASYVMKYKPEFVDIELSPELVDAKTNNDGENLVPEFPQKEWNYTSNGTPIPGRKIVDENTGVEYTLNSTAGDLPENHI